MRRQLVFRTFEDMLSEVDALRTREHTRAGNWDLAQICTHLGGALDASRSGFDFRAPWLLRKIIARAAFRRMLRTGRLPSGVKIPQRHHPPAGLSSDTAVAELRSAAQRFEQHEGPLAPHWFFGRLTRDEWRQLHLIHGARHLGHLVPSA